VTTGGDWREHVARFDDAVEQAIDRLRSPALDHVMYALSSAADHSVLWHAIGLARAARQRSLAPTRRLSKILAIESALTNGPVKLAFGRLRPEPRAEPPERMPYGMRVPITSSFPSGHATSAFCAATVLAEDGGAAVWYSLAALVATSRVYVRMHHASDVVAGAAFGLLLGATLRRLIR
jgi:undecaprenyl-diphosphatase